MSFKIFCSSQNSLNCSKIGPTGPAGPPGPSQLDFGTYTPTTDPMIVGGPDILSLFVPANQQLSNFQVTSPWSYIITGDLVTISGTVQFDCGDTDLDTNPTNFPAATSLYIRALNNYPISQNPQVINGIATGGQIEMSPNPLITSIVVGTEPTYQYIKFILRTNDNSLWNNQTGQFLNISFTYKSTNSL